MSTMSLWILAYLWAVVVTPCQSWGQPASEGKRNYYDTLGVQQTATDRQVKKAFRRLAMSYHPDRNKTKDAEKIFREIAEAYEVLSNKEKRKRYDELGHEAYLESEGDSSVRPEEDDSTPFYFTFDMFQGSDYDDDPFVTENSWSFPIEFEDNTYEDHSYTDFDHMGDSHYEHQDEFDQQFCYLIRQPDGNIVEECVGEW